jgi:hypothetical protein
MIEISTERKRDEEGKPQFLLTGFTQTAGTRIYAFERKGDAQKLGYTVEVNLALIPGYGIRIQDLPLLCRDVLQQREQPDDLCASTLTEQKMRSHAEELAAARATAAEHRKRQPRHLPNAEPVAAYQPPLP